jgi:hypothetical protein
MFVDLRSKYAENLLSEYHYRGPTGYSIVRELSRIGFMKFTSQIYGW